MRFRYGIGNGWGDPEGPVVEGERDGTEHFMVKVRANEWKSVCERLLVKPTDWFGGLARLDLNFEIDREIAKVCPDCLTVLRRTRGADYEPLPPSFQEPETRDWPREIQT